MSRRFLTRWFAGNSIRPQHRGLPVRQVYAWIVTEDMQAVVVSKDGASWQLPGGKPAPGESWLQAMLRETAEETGVELTGCASAAQMFGYYAVRDLVENAAYLQLRIRVQLPVKELLFTIQEPKEDPEAGKIRYARLFPLGEMEQLMPWCGEEKTALLHALLQTL